MKRSLIAAASAVVLAVGLAGCSSGTSAGTPTSSAATIGDCKLSGKANTIKLHPVTPGTLTVATSLPNPGSWDGATLDTIKSGFEYCLAAEIAHAAGYTSMKVLNVNFAGLLQGKVSGFDIAMASTTITPARAKVIDFSQPYFHANLGVAVRTGSGVTEKNLREKKIGVLQGNIGSDWVSTVLKPKTAALQYQTDADLFTALAANQVDAIVTDTTLCLAGVHASNGSQKVVGQFDVRQGYGIMTPLGSENSAAVKDGLAQLLKAGVVDDLAKKYLEPLYGVDPNSIPMWTVQK